MIEEHKLILTDIGANSNKFWHGRLDDDFSVTTEWGRVGESGQSQTKCFNDSLAASKYLDGKRKEKERKGYSVQRTIGAAPVRVAAHTLIESSDDTKDLLDYLVKVNIHNITANTNISFDVTSGSFQTPLGVITDDGIRDAEQLLTEIGKRVVTQDYEDMSLINLVNRYMRIIPSDVGRKKVGVSSLFPDAAAVQAQQQILDALKASLQALETRTDDGTVPSYRAKLNLLAHDGANGTATFKRIYDLFKTTLNNRHQAASLRLKKVYEVSLNGMTTAYESDGAKMSNIMELWHGTKAANLLSIMNSGYVVPRSGSSIAVTGRMFGDGVYFSDQSTKSLNYSAGYWGGGSSERTFMLLNDVAMGKAYVPARSFSGGCPSGYDSTFAKANVSGVMNNEMIVYRTSQILPKFLCEFGS